MKFTENFARRENGKRSNKIQRNFNPLWVKVTGVSTVDTDAYSWKAVKFSNDTNLWEDQATTGDLLYEANELPLEVGQYVKMQYAGYDSTNSRAWYVCQTPAPVSTDLFPVNLTKTSGIAGDNDDQCTWKYTAKSLDDVTTYGTVLTPKKQRPAVGSMTSGDGLVGLGYYDDSSVFQLYDANEVQTTVECVTG